MVKRRDRLSTVSYPFNPLDAVGWHGDLAPVRLNWRDLRPIVSARYHVPPSAHVNFVAERFAVGTFAPRPIESDPGALKVPFFHDDDDVDEIIFLHRGQFFSRDNFGPGMLSLHPCGFPHGPQPKAFAIGARRARTETDEVAVYIDTFDAVEMAELPAGSRGPKLRRRLEGARTVGAVQKLAGLARGHHIPENLCEADIIDPRPRTSHGSRSSL